MLCLSLNKSESSLFNTFTFFVKLNLVSCKRKKKNLLTHSFKKLEMEIFNAFLLEMLICMFTIPCQS